MRSHRLIRLSIFLYVCLNLLPGVLEAQTGTLPTGTDPSCPTGIFVYQKTFGGNKDEIGYDMALAPDSGFVVTGTTKTFGSGGYDGFFMKLNKKGDVIWSKAVGGAADDVLYLIKKTSDNGFIACGQTKSYGNPAGDAWLVKIDAAGTVEWSKKYGNGNGNGEMAWDVIQTSDGGYAFSGVHQFAGGVSESFVVRTDNQGTAIWSRQYGHSGSDEAGGLIEDGNFLIVVGFYQGGSLYDSYMMQLDKTTGTMNWIKGFDAESRSTMFVKVKQTSIGYQVVGLIMDDYISTNVQLGVWNINSAGTVINVRKTNIPGIQTSSFGVVSDADGGFVISNSQDNSSSDVLLTHVNATGSIIWSKKYQRAGKQWVRAITAAAENGYALIGANNNPGTPADSNNVFVLRVDNLGDGGVCPGINTNDVTITTPTNSIPATSVSAPGTVTLNPQVITVGVVSFSPEINLLCYDCKLPLPVIPPDTTCTNGISLFQKVYGGNKEDIGYDAALAIDSGYVIAGTTKSFGNGGVDGFMTKVNRKGNIVWSRAFGGAADDVLYLIKKTSDNGFIACGQTKSFGNPAGDAWLVKVDASGSVQWSKKYGNGNANGEMAWDVVQTSDGGYAFCGVHQFAGGVSESFVVRTDNQGAVIWSKQYGHSGSDEAGGLIEDGNFLVVVGFYQGASLYDSYMMQLDKASGTLNWIKGYDAEGRSAMFVKIRKNNTSYQVQSINMDDFNGTNVQNGFWNFAPDGTVQSFRKMVIPGLQTSSFGCTYLADGSFIAVNSEDNANGDLLISQVKANGTLGWSKKYQRAGRQLSRSIIQATDGGFAVIGLNNNVGTLADSSHTYFVRIDSLGDSGFCSGVNTTDVTVSTLSFVTPTTSVSAPGNVTINNPVISVGVIDYLPVLRNLCFYCQPKPTGSMRPVPGGIQHILQVYPNPVEDNFINLSIHAEYPDHAAISIIDMSGNTVFTSGRIEVRKGDNRVTLNLPFQLRQYTYYIIRIRYELFSSTRKIFVLHQ